MLGGLWPWPSVFGLLLINLVAGHACKVRSLHQKLQVLVRAPCRSSCVHLAGPLHQNHRPPRRWIAAHDSGAVGPARPFGPPGSPRTRLIRWRWGQDAPKVCCLCRVGAGLVAGRRSVAGIRDALAGRGGGAARLWGVLNLQLARGCRVAEGRRGASEGPVLAAGAVGPGVAEERFVIAFRCSGCSACARPRQPHTVCDAAAGERVFCLELCGRCIRFLNKPLSLHPQHSSRHSSPS